MRKILIALAVVIVLIVVADRVALYLAQRKVADQVAAAYSLPNPPVVTIQGFPFLNQVAAGSYQQIDVTLNSVDQNGVQLENLQAQFQGVHAPLRQLISAGQSGGAGAASITADRAAATAVIPFATVQRRLPAGIRLSPDNGRLKLSGKVTYQGFVVPVSGAVSLHVTPDAIRVTPRNLTVAGAVPVPLSLVGSRLAFTLPVHDLPMHLAVTSVRVTANGFKVSASGQNVAFTNRG